MGHPLDQLSPGELKAASSLCQASRPSKLAFNTITLHEPPKALLLQYYKDDTSHVPRQAFVIAYESGTTILLEFFVDLTAGKVLNSTERVGACPIITLEDLQGTEDIVRQDPHVIQLCEEIGITDMSKVYCDAWTIGFDERASKNDNAYAHPLDFCPIVDMQAGKVIEIDVKAKEGSKFERAPVPLEEQNYMPQFIKDYRTDVKPINITQPEGVSFDLQGQEISWLGWKMHIGFNAREGIVLNNIRIEDPETKEERSLFHRLSIAEMVVPYGCPTKPHHRKHALDVGEYGCGAMTNSLSLGCDCKGSISYLDGYCSNRAGEAFVIKNAVCIHEQDDGILFKHTDFRDGTVIATRDRKLVISQIFTAANYEYCIYWSFKLDGTIQLEMQLTGQLNTYVLSPDEEAGRYGTEISSRVTAHNHQHLFNVRIDPAIDGQHNTVVQSDIVPGEDEVGSPGNFYGNAFYAKKTKYATVKEAAVDYCHETSRTWDICNLDKVNAICKKPVAYKIVSRESPRLLAKEGSLVWKRAFFARKTLYVTRYEDNQLYPAGNYVPQTSGLRGVAGNDSLEDWCETQADLSLEQQDIVIWLTFGLSHIPRVEDGPIMPTEPVSFLLRANNFFSKNPALHIPPSYATYGQDGKTAWHMRDKVSKLEISRDAEGKKGCSVC